MAAATGLWRALGFRSPCFAPALHRGGPPLERQLARLLHASAPTLQGGPPPREAMEFDACIVGAGPAGLAAAIRLKQVCGARRAARRRAAWGAVLMRAPGPERAPGDTDVQGRRQGPQRVCPGERSRSG